MAKIIVTFKSQVYKCKCHSVFTFCKYYFNVFALKCPVAYFVMKYRFNSLTFILCSCFMFHKIQLLSQAQAVRQHNVKLLGSQI